MSREDAMRKEVWIRIDNNLQDLPSTFSENTIFRVPSCLQEVNMKAYEPRIISIGPYHHGKPHLKLMEVHKMRFLCMLLKRINARSAKIVVALMQDEVKKARNCYAEPFKMSDESFLEMLVLDGCFIVELIHQCNKWNKDEYVIKNHTILGETIRDLIPFENQLPFFILLKLFKMMNCFESENYVYLLLSISKSRFPGLRFENFSMGNVNHLLDLIVRNWLPSRELMEDYSRASKDGKWSSIRTATELKEAGIPFKKGEGKSLFDIKFKNGVLEIPTITIGDNTESLYRNVIVSEQFGHERPTYFTDFQFVMDSLINTGKDVQLLRHCDVIDNHLGDDEAVAAIFNRLGDHVRHYPKDFFYAKLCKDVNKHFCKLRTRRNRWKTSLRRNYFNTPWALISFLAAVFLLVLTMLQTFFFSSVV